MERAILEAPKSQRSPEPSHPPSEPRPRASAPSLSSRDADTDSRPARAQLVALIVLGFVLVAVPLYLWRRPRAIPETSAEPASSEIPIQAAADAGAPEAGLALVKLGDPIIVECHDPGPKKTAPEQCGHLPAFEKAFAHAIENAGSCVPSGSRPSSLVFVADVSYARQKSRAIQIYLPKDGRSVKPPKIATSCETSVESGMKSVELDGEHGHQRYKIQITASYP
jgi:hypothetical protein